MLFRSSLPTLVPLLRAQVLTARAQFAEALLLYESELEKGVGEGMERLRADLLADQSWCRLRLGQREMAMRDAAAAEAAIDPNGQFDDRAMAHVRLAQIFTEVGDLEKARQQELLASDAWSGHKAVQAKILELLSALPEVEKKSGFGSTNG